jgi:hypothetical protein
MGEPLDRLAKASPHYDVSKVVVHRGGKEIPPTSALRRGVRALSVEHLPALLGGAK